jgi:hypothetical protein
MARPARCSSRPRRRARYWDSPDAFERAIEDGLAADAVLFEGGAFADFLAVRGSLLPADERLLAAQWLLVQRSVHEVLGVRRGEQMILRDVRTGDVHEVRERAGSRQVKVGELYCARVVPAGDTMQIFGGIEPVSLGERDELIALLDDDPDPLSSSSRFCPADSPRRCCRTPRASRWCCAMRRCGSQTRPGWPRRWMTNMAATTTSRTAPWLGSST